jgi:hypothetical protein
MKLLRQFLIVASLIALAGFASAVARSASWPEHSVPSVQCDYKYGIGDVILSPMPNIRARPEATNTLINIDDSGNRQSGGSPTEWNFYTIDVYTPGTGWQLSQKWNTTNNPAYVSGAGQAFTLVNGAWHAAITGYGVGGYEANSNMIVGPGYHYVVGVYYWGPIPGYSWLGPLYEPVGWVNCPSS